MCGRYNITDNPLLQRLLTDLGINIGPLPVRYNISPTDFVPVIYKTESDRNQLTEMRWWLTPSWSKGPSTKYAMFNARVETLEKSAAFRGPFRHKHAVIPASSFIEWRQDEEGKRPYLIEPVEGVFAFAGLWDYWSDGNEELYSCTIITGEAPEGFRHVHNRSPFILAPNDILPWLNLERVPYKPIHPVPVKVSPLDLSINNSRNKFQPKVVGEPELIP